MRTLYDILRSTPDSPYSELKKAYHNLARKFHPDKQSVTDGDGGNGIIIYNPEEPGKEFMEITKAWKILSDEELRRQYDSWLREQIFREDTAIIYDHVNIDEILDGWTPIGQAGESEKIVEEYSLQCRCGGEYTFNSMEPFQHTTLYVLCSNCSLVVKIDIGEN